MYLPLFLPGPPKATSPFLKSLTKAVSPSGIGDRSHPMSHSGTGSIFQTTATRASRLRARRSQSARMLSEEGTASSSQPSKPLKLDCRGL